MLITETIFLPNQTSPSNIFFFKSTHTQIQWRSLTWSDNKQRDPGSRKEAYNKQLKKTFLCEVV